MTAVYDQHQDCLVFSLSLHLYLGLVTIPVDYQPERIFGLRVRRRTRVLMPIDKGLRCHFLRPTSQKKYQNSRTKR